MLLRELLYDGEYLNISSPEVLDIDIGGITSDSRDVRSGYAFVCLKGTQTDGALYIYDSADRGAVLCIGESVPLFCTMPYVIVKNARLCLSNMLYRFWGKPAQDMKIFAVTGTNGKTSTCSFLYEILLWAGKRAGFIGTLKCYVGRERFYLGDSDDEKMSTMTTPDPEQFYKILHGMRERGVEYLVMEASSHALRLDKLAPLRFYFSAFTNFSAEHLDFHSSLSDYLLSKCKIFSNSDNICLNIDDSVCRSALGVFLPRTVTCGVESDDADCRVRDVESYGVDGISYTMYSENAIIKIRSRVFGSFAVYNTLMAATIAHAAGISASVIADAIASVSGVEGRMQKIKLPPAHSDISVLIDYAHTEKAMENLLSAVNAVKRPEERIVTVFGCGGDRDRTKRAPMGRVASKYSDLVIVTEDNSRGEDPDSIIRDIMCGIDDKKPHIIIKNRKKAIEYAIINAQKNDMILLVGKGHEQYEITSHGKQPFSEKQIVLDSLGRRKNGGSK